MKPCPACQQYTLYPISVAEAVTCQNPECRVVFDAQDQRIGTWSAGYGEFVKDGGVSGK